jgi:hypothetical protein
VSGETSMRFNFLEGKNTVNPAMRKVAANATVMSTVVKAASIAATAGMVTFGVAAVGAAAHVVALGQSAIVASQSVLLLPSAIAAAVGTAIAGKLAFGGLGEAWKQTGAAAVKGGGASVDVARQVELANRSVRDATQSLADAQREAREAQEAVTRARENAAERLEDLSRSLRGARLDERGAVLALQEARKRLSEARGGGGDAADIRRAQLAYEEAKLTLESVRDRVQDLSKEQQEAAAKGVEGSDEVQQAVLRQEQAQRQLTAATERLADAQRELARAGKGAGGGVDKAAQALAALAPSAAALVLTLRAMGPAWSAAGKNAQQATWAGVAEDFQSLGMIYLPRVAGWATRMGQAFNVAIRSTLGLLQTNQFATDVGKTLEFIDQTVMRLGKSLAPFINGFMQFVVVGSSFLPGIAGSVGSIAERFQAWAVAARESGQMQQWISTGLATLNQFWQLAKNLVLTVVAIFRAGENTGTLDALVAGSVALRAWAESAEGQQKIAETLAFLRNIFTDLIQVVPAFVGHAGILSNTLSVFGVVVEFLADHLDTFAAALPAIVTLFIAWKTAQTVATAAMVVGIPLRIVELGVTLKQIAALRAHSAALTANTMMQRASTVSTVAGTVATTAADVAQKRSIVSIIAARAAMIAGAAATAIVTAAQWLWNAAMYANPIGLVILAIVALIAVIVLIIKYHKEIGAFFVMVWGHIWDFLKMIGAWFAGPFVQFFKDAWANIVGLFNAGVAWVTGWVNRFLAPILAIKDHIAKVGIWQTLVDGFKAAINGLIGLWNRLDFSIGPFSIPSWVPFGLGGQRFYIPDIFPDIPRLDVGGRITETGMAVVHKGEEVVTAAEVTRSRSGGGSRDLRIIFGSDGSTFGDMVLEGVRKAVRARGGDFDAIVFES